MKVVASIDGSNVSLDASESGTYAAEAVAPLSSTDIFVTATDEAGNSETETVFLSVDDGWLPPKTDWKVSYDASGKYTGDYFNIEDYNRIIGNLTYLKALANTLFLPFTTADMGSEKTYSSMIYAREINVIENNLEVINQNTYRLNIGKKVTYQANKYTPLWSELNRIESACLLLYKTMMAHKAALPKLSFTLGRQKGVRV